MTFDQRVRALEHLGFSEPQTRFIVTVALHSGFCLRRHYAKLTGLKYGAGVRGFLDRLVSRGLARRQGFRPDRGHVYHLHHTGIYIAIGQDDNRNRRHTSPALIARKLMLFDYVLGHPELEWIATEQDKVALFTERFGVPLFDLPHRVYYAARRDGGRTTTRYFVHKLPIGLQPDNVTVTFVVLVTDLSGQLLSQFLTDHQPLLSRLPDWRIIAVLPGHVAGLPACEVAFKRFWTSPAPRRSAAQRDDLRFAFRIRDLIDGGKGLGTVRVTEIDRFRNIRDSYNGSEFERLLLRWRASGDGAFEDDSSDRLRAAVAAGRGQFEIHRLAIRYDRFGTRAGVS
jgi:hypothetical protein